MPATGCRSKPRLLLAAMGLGSRLAVYCEARAEHQGQAVVLLSGLLTSLLVSLPSPCMAGSLLGARGVAPAAQHPSFLPGCTKAERSRDNGASTLCSGSKVW